MSAYRKIQFSKYFLQTPNSCLVLLQWYLITVLVVYCKVYSSETLLLSSPSQSVQIFDGNNAKHLTFSTSFRSFFVGISDKSIKESFRDLILRVQPHKPVFAASKLFVTHWSYKHFKTRKWTDRICYYRVYQYVYKIITTYHLPYFLVFSDETAYENSGRSKTTKMLVQLLVTIHLLLKLQFIYPIVCIRAAQLAKITSNLRSCKIEKSSCV